MKRYRLLLLVLGVALAGFNVLLVYSGEPNKVSDEFRKRFIKNFQRNWLNTTEGDAMMLRILVESAGAKRGVEVGSANGFGERRGMAPRLAPPQRRRPAHGNGRAGPGTRLPG